MQPLRLVAVLAAACTGVGCGAIGSVDIAHARTSYNDIIRRTDDEQLLRMIVNTRYGESSGLLVVASVTSNLSVKGTVGANVGIGPSANYAGNLVPLSVGLEYEENPTISYIPKQGQEYVRELLAPIPLESVVLLAGAAREPGRVLAACVAEINGVRNADRGAPRPTGSDPFARVCELLGTLTKRHAFCFARSSADAGGYKLAFRDYAPEHTAEVQELLRLLHLDPALAGGQGFDLPLALAVHDAAGTGIDVLTRSPHELLQLAAVGVEVPPEDEAAGLTGPLAIPAAGAADAPEIVRVHSARELPAGALMAIQHRGWWFYVDDSDWQSKQGFLLLRHVILTRLQGAEQAAAPLLTIPTSH